MAGNEQIEKIERKGRKGHENSGVDIERATRVHHTKSFYMSERVFALEPNAKSAQQPPSTVWANSITHDLHDYIPTRESRA